MGADAIFYSIFLHLVPVLHVKHSRRRDNRGRAIGNGATLGRPFTPNLTKRHQ